MVQELKSKFSFAKIKNRVSLQTEFKRQNWHADSEFNSQVKFLSERVL